MPTFFGDNNTPRRSDPSWVVLQKILGTLNGTGGSAGVIAQQVYVDRDPSPPDNTARPAINTRSDGGAWTTWIPANQAWS